MVYRQVVWAIKPFVPSRQLIENDVTIQLHKPGLEAGKTDNLLDLKTTLPHQFNLNPPFGN